MPTILRWDACLNVRDLGGLDTTDGRRVRVGALVRADTLCRLTPAGQRALVEHGVKTVIDLARPEEHPGPHPYLGSTGPRYVNILTSAYRDAAGQAALDAAGGNHVATYRTSLDVNQRGFGAVCRAIAEAEPGGVVLHCHAGKDRTGIVVALLLALVGVPDDAIVADYALSYPNLAAEYDRQLDAEGVTDPAAREALHRLRRSDPTTMWATLAHLHEHQGGAEAYLRAAGLTPEELDALRARLLE